MNTALRTLATAAAIALPALYATDARADCSVKIRDLRQVAFGGHDGRGYEVFDRNQHSEVVEFTVERISGSCAVHVGFSAGQSNSFDSRRLTSRGDVLYYQLDKTVGATGGLKDMPFASEEETFSGFLAPGQDSLAFRFVFLIPLLQIVPPGTYQDMVMVRVYEGTLQSPQLHDQQQLQLSARVPTLTEFCLGDTVVFEAGYQNACVNFGDIRTGAERELMLHARSNAGYRITLRSKNGGALRIADPEDTSEIPYTLQVDGQPISLTGKQPVTAAQGNGLTSAFGTEHHLRFKVGDVSAASAGDYEDVIEITQYPER